MLRNTRIRIRSAPLLCLTCALVGGAYAGVDPPPAVDGAEMPQLFAAIPRAVPRSLNVPDVFNAGNRIVMPALDVAKLMEEDAQLTAGSPLRMGMVQDFESHAAQRGLWSQLPDGGLLWTLAVQATGAKALRVRVSDWNPPLGAELIVYDPQNPKYALGPITRTYLPQPGELWTPTVYSDEAYLELYLPPGGDPNDPAAQIQVDGVLNQYRAFPLGGGGAADELPCNLDVTCYPPWVFEANGVAALSYVANPFGFFCSGAMLNRIPTDFTPMFMTAAHCGVTSGTVTNLLVTWFYQTSVCNGVPPDPATLPQTGGVVVLARRVDLDWTLVGLAFAVPGGVTFEGWDANYFGNGSSATSISHPAGSYKRIAFGSKINDNGTTPDPANPPNCMGSNHTWVQFPEGNGRIEPGSSGSPIFDGSGRVRGTLSCGGPRQCPGTEDGTYGRLDQMYPDMQPYLVPTDPIYVDWSFGGFELGTLAQPFRTVLAGVYAVQAGSNVYIATGSYNERPVIRKAMTLHARNGIAVIGQ